jgi:hypothetical protein
VTIKFFLSRLFCSVSEKESVMKKARMLLAVALVAAITPMANGEEPSQRDQLQSAVQGICPVSGQALGSMGAPIKVQVGEQTVFLCCKGCLGKQINPQHWARIHANFAAAQGICPVMKHQLPKSPKWTMVEGQIVYVCCPPCIKKITADPETYLEQVDVLYTAFLQKKAAAQ